MNEKPNTLSLDGWSDHTQKVLNLPKELRDAYSLLAGLASFFGCPKDYEEPLGGRNPNVLFALHRLVLVLKPALSKIDTNTTNEISDKITKLMFELVEGKN